MVGDETVVHGPHGGAHGSNGGHPAPGAEHDVHSVPGAAARNSRTTRARSAVLRRWSADADRRGGPCAACTGCRRCRRTTRPARRGSCAAKLLNVSSRPRTARCRRRPRPRCAMPARRPSPASLVRRLLERTSRRRRHVERPARFRAAGRTRAAAKPPITAAARGRRTSQASSAAGESRRSRPGPEPRPAGRSSRVVTSRRRASPGAAAGVRRADLDEGEPGLVERAWRSGVSASPRRARGPRPRRPGRRWRGGRRRCGGPAGTGTGRRRRRTGGRAGRRRRPPGARGAGGASPRPGWRTPRRRPAPRATVGRPRRGPAPARGPARPRTGRRTPAGRRGVRRTGSRGAHVLTLQNAASVRGRGLGVAVVDTVAGRWYPASNNFNGKWGRLCVFAGVVCPHPATGVVRPGRSVARALPSADVGFPRRPFVVFRAAAELVSATGTMRTEVSAHR